jgi:uncharacterized membrane-anchored protein
VIAVANQSIAELEMSASVSRMVEIGEQRHLWVLADALGIPLGDVSKALTVPADGATAQPLNSAAPIAWPGKRESWKVARDSSTS